ncbi:conserved hypothetical protein [Vibrio nigripulchritudo SOn1]|uniref:Uncharacterized protein n=1 Tax=Vibrio nigripulchritudo SOn1 TaxID=1238450 RepID=A0AAV2VQB1_9VIBR|nr:hypothetical protein [Vibrio nigripulchritudo]CCO46832.1 conserved hypothetical protein [Vibrio nigripulchritudo SOn1]
MKTRVRKTPLYKPAVYAKLLNRADISLAVLLQNDIQMYDKSLVVSQHLSSHFGLAFDGMNVFVGVPHQLWEGFERINWQSFSVDESELYLVLNFDVDVERTITNRTSFGNHSETKAMVDRLALKIPYTPVFDEQLSNCSFVHICEMSNANERTTTPSIPITKIAYTNTKG